MRVLEDFTAAYGNARVNLRAYIVTTSPEEPDLLASTLRVDVVSTENFPAEVFVWEKADSMADSGTVSQVIRPVCVAKPSDLSVYPVAAAYVQAAGKLPYYRDSFLQFTIESPALLLDTWTHIKEDVQGLVSTVVRLGGAA